MTLVPVLICQSSMLAERGKGLRFPVIEAGTEASGFVVRFKGVVYGYLNRCAHVPMELDWTEGEFFDTTGLYLMCATHGAVYEPESGRCAGGPCRGGRLQQIVVTEQDNQVFWHPDKFLQPPGAKSPQK